MSIFKLILLPFLLLQPITLLFGQGVWTQKADFPSIHYNAASFSIGTKGYIVTGNNLFTTPYSNVTWEYDSGTDTWLEKANFIGQGRHDAVGFSVNGKGYLFGGYVGNGQFKNELFEYNPVTDTWTQKANCPGMQRDNAIAFVIGDTAYIGTGEKYMNSMNDLWAYCPSTDTWTQKANIGGIARRRAIAFSIGGKGYVGTGDSFSNGIFMDFWEYNPINDTWTQKADFSGGVRAGAVGFSIGNKGYICSGTTNLVNTKDFWEYNPATDSWTQLIDFGGAERLDGSSFVIGSKAYVGIGITNPNESDFWQFTPGKLNQINKEETKDLISIYPMPFSNQTNIKLNRSVNDARLILYDVLGQEVQEIKNINGNEIILSRGHLPSGIYFLELSEGNSILFSSKISIN
jgi:N-acetylneuraminic acid mutarotase